MERTGTRRDIGRLATGAGLIAALEMLVSGGPVTAASTQDANKAVVQRYLDEVINQGNLAAVETVIASDYQSSDPNDAPGRASLKQRLTDGARQRAALITDYRINMDAVVAEGDVVAVRAHLTGTSKSGRSLNALQLSFYQLRSGQIVTVWDLEDTQAIFNQVGAM